MNVTIHEAGAVAAPAANATAPATAETPSQKIVKAADRRATATDDEGRVIEVKALTALDLYRLTKLLGANSANQQALNIAMSACSVTAIDGERITPPNSEREIEAMIQRLDFHGLQAATIALVQLQIPTLAEVKDQAGNS
ncbi:hypothetical protein GCM10007036_14460 [Alsobacter metallidurans]|uniref:Uncharacterized protein n=1 Tax=Alsobacter metallidurans TaxID=340221 RepID=A0A917MH60_9HYPH|nr:hypothetical protein [Alsobacter metallidurans]GGH14870.1 hypothetical protein GCM10007036_14460 [Alsobacter metallidurans]